MHYRSGSPPTRLHTSWRGPMRVLSEEYHVSDMKKFLYDPDHVDPVDVARRDYMEFFVESIVSHRGNLTRSAIEFLVKWRDYPDSQNS